MGLENVSRTVELMARIEAIARFSKIETYVPYPWQERGHACLDAGGRPCKQILTLAGNKVGKTQSGAFDDAYHLTGRYPDWWGKDWPRFSRPIKAQVAGQTAVSTRDTIMSMLLGEMGDPKAWGTGSIPKDCLPDRDDSARCSRWPGIPNSVQSVTVAHAKGGNSLLTFKSYDQEASTWMGTGVDLNHLDEEPPESHYSQALRATIATGGLTKLTMTPEAGMTAVVKRFKQDLQPGQLLIVVTWDDAPHLTEEIKKQLLAAFPPHEREMRSKGIPIRGSGLVFPVVESSITIPAFPLPLSWPRIAGIDFGMSHATAVAWLAFDRETKTAYVYDCYKKTETQPAVHAAAINLRGKWIPKAWPHDGMRRDGYAGIGIAETYKKLDVKMLRDRFMNPDGTFAVEPGVFAMLVAMQAGQFKVFAHLHDWFEEFRDYHRKDGEIVKLDDDLMSATRYAFQSQRFAKMEEPLQYPEGPVAGTNDYDPFQSPT